VHALETLHTTLRPQGLLLDVRPAPQHPWVEVQRGGAMSRSGCGGRLGGGRLGQVDDSYRIGTLAIADAALQTVIDAGRWVRERAETFTFVYHFDSVEAWLAYMAEHWSTAHLSTELIARAREEWSGAADELRIPRVIQAARLRRL
jgi:hypothetical protein